MDDKIAATIGVFEENGHLAPAALETLRNGQLCGSAMLLALEHIGGCEACAAAFASSFDGDEQAPVPAGFEEELRNKLLTAKKGSHAFAYYVMRVAIAACIALIIMFSSAFNAVVKNQSKMTQIEAPNFGFVNAISEQLNVFSQNIVNDFANMEVFNYVQAKK